jgi:phosphatidylglycerophosphate synthase
LKTVDRITDLEEQTRDRILGPLILFVIPPWIKPNHITFSRFLLVCLAMGMFFAGSPIQHQAWVLVAAAVTDCLDGILARARKQISRKGAYLDHATDWFLGGWTGILVLINGLLPTLFILLIAVPQLGVLIIDRIRASRIGAEKKSERALAITMGAANFRPSSINRLQFFAILLGFFFLIFGQVWDASKLQQAGLACLYTAVGLAWFLLMEGLNIQAGNLSGRAERQFLKVFPPVADKQQQRADGILQRRNPPDISNIQLGEYVNNGIDQRKPDEEVGDQTDLKRALGIAGPLQSAGKSHRHGYKRLFHRRNLQTEHPQAEHLRIRRVKQAHYRKGEKEKDYPD